MRLHHWVDVDDMTQECRNCRLRCKRRNVWDSSFKTRKFYRPNGSVVPANTQCTEELKPC